MTRSKLIAIGLVCCALLTLVIVLSVVLTRDNDDDDDGGNPAPSKEPISLTENMQLAPKWESGSLELTVSGIPTAKIAPVTAYLGRNVELNGSRVCTDSHGIHCRSFVDGRRLEILESVKTSELDCVTVEWSSAGDVTSRESGEDCYDMLDTHWFGGFEENRQHWALDEFVMNSSAFVTGHAWDMGEYGDVIEPIFLSSAGVGIHVDEATPLYLSINEAKSKQLCLVGRTGANTPYYHGSQSASLRYHICKSSNIASLWKAMAEQFIAKPTAGVSEDVLHSPIWCTWAKYKGAINQTTTLEYANLIRENNFPASQLEIDDEWTPKYGDLVFTTDKFPDASELIQNLTSEGFPITVWVHPFFNNDSQAFQELSKKNYLLKDLHSAEPALTEWWRGNHAGVIDVTNPDAVTWYLNKLEYIKTNYSVISFKFDAGETNWLPKKFTSHVDLPNPNMYSKKYVEMAYRADLKERRQEVRAGYRSQNTSMMVRMLDRASNWSHQRGLKTVIPCALAFGIMGYPFVLPDLIGGNAMDTIALDHTVLPERELYIRWMEATTFLPVLQFSVGPWDYDEEVVNITRKYVQLHQNFSDLIVNLSKEAVVTGHPIVRPLWWTDPTDSTALTLETQFLLGNDLLVAPVLEQGAESRDIYILNGDWQDELRGGILRGPRWEYNYTVALHELAYFTRVTA
ncbi:myogenesis-regulating glycosidase [Aplysia californica]|uniref:Myogenesis-regulating glycosidase n=1 Tax=Aplysia californica TaxID=6500 RepID=A0ABM0JQQ3_APLCA|nr:myogenesis-regulating glycosidase [Aplysia californica]XP_012938502.1 myogenesis-regulating glycosidase [Aplysia californica]XP_035825891.1 myogenesis-regulating glycosidase [Aplysia californica]